jgi:transcription termination factor Rho
MNERPRPPRRGRGRGPRPYDRSATELGGEDNPYRESPTEGGSTAAAMTENAAPPPPEPQGDGSGNDGAEMPPAPQHAPPVIRAELAPPALAVPAALPVGGPPFAGPPLLPREPREQNGRRGRRNRGRGRQQGGAPNGGPGVERQQSGPPVPVQIVPTGETKGWFDPSRDGGFIRRPGSSYLADAGDAYVSPQLVRQYSLRKSDEVSATTGRDPRGRTVLVEITAINGDEPQNSLRRPDFNTLTATYPERKLFLETGRPAKAGNELIRRAIDLIAPIGYGQRALIVAPARAGKTTLLHAITEGIALNHPNAALLILLVDERPEEVSEAISWGVGEVIASSFDQPAARHVEVTEMVLERARRLVEVGKDVVIVLDSLTRMARAHNTAERGTGRTMSGGLDAQAMAKPKAFFGSARAVDPKSGGGSLTIIATALVETGSRMDDIIFEEFKGTGNCEIKLDRSLAEKRIYPAIDIATSGTRREEKLFRPDQLDHVYTLRRGLSQMPPQSGMEWLIKRIGATTGNDALLAGL